MGFSNLSNFYNLSPKILHAMKKDVGGLFSYPRLFPWCLPQLSQLSHRTFKGIVYMCNTLSFQSKILRAHST